MHASASAQSSLNVGAARAQKWHDLARKMDVKHQKKHAKQKRAGEDDNAQ